MIAAQGLDPAAFAKLPPEQQMIIQQQMMQAAQANQNNVPNQEILAESMNMQGMAPQQAEIQDQQPKKIKGKRYNGLLEWIMDRDGHEFMVEVDREFIRDKFNYHGLREKFIDELNISEDNMSERQFQIYIKHLYKAAAPTQENL